MLKTAIISILFIISFSGVFAQASVGGTLSSIDTAKCISGNTGSIQLNGSTGNIIRWEYSYSGGDPWTPIAHTSAIYNFTNLSESISFRAIVQVPANLPATSSVIRIHVYQTSLGGTIAGASEVCQNTNYSYTLSGTRGKILNWEQSTNGGSTWTAIVQSTDSTLLSRSFVQNTIYRSEVKNGACPTVISPSFLITAYQPSVSGTLSGTDSVCKSGNTVALNLGGSVGTNYNWQTSPNPNGSWTAVGSNATTFSTSNLENTSFYRVSVKNGTCPESTSGVYKVVVSQLSNGGTITGNMLICIGDSVLLTNVNYTGVLLNWEKSTNNGSSWTGINHTADSYLDNNAATDTWYRTSVKNGVCPIATSAIKNVTVSPLPVPDFSFSNACSGILIPFTNLTPGSNTYAWDYGDGTGNNVTNSNHTYSNAGNYTVTMQATNSSGCLNTISHPITVYARPTASFQVEDTICLTDQVVFANLSQNTQGSIVNYTWNFNGLGTSNLANPTFSQFTTGANPVTLTVLNSAGCSDSVSKVLMVRDKPIAGFEFQNACLGLPIAFTNTSFGGNAQVSCNWNFGDGQGSVLTSPLHTYGASGNYNVSLIVSNSYQCADTLVQPLSVFNQPQIDFTSNNVCLGDTTFFTPAVTGITGYSANWNFGDGFSDTTQTTSHVYSNYGDFQVQFTVASDSGCVQNIIKNVKVYALPNAVFNIQNGCMLDSLVFTNYSSIPNGSIDASWDLGNNVTSTDWSPVNAYQTEGVYQIRLAVMSNFGCADTTLSTLTIFDKPQAAFTASNVCYGVPVTFTNNSVVIFGSISTVLWDFGDNSNSTIYNPQKEYMNNGSYNVSLIVQSSNGCSDTLVKTVLVYDAPIANFTAYNSCLGNQTTFDNTTTLDNGSFSSVWHFGDGNTSVQFAPQYLFEDAGIYMAKLVVTTDFGCMDSISKPVVIYNLPAANAGADAQIDKGYHTQLSGSGGSTYTWSPSNGLVSPNTASTPASPDLTTTYILTVLDNNGCLNSDSVTVYVEDSYKIKPYNLLTPDGNGKNDTWIIENIETYPANSVAVFNELGHEIWRMDAYDNTWDGRNKTGEIITDGTYYYIITFNGSDKVYKGDLLLIRNHK
ncbi:Protease 1 precursor [compost metagenome]